MSTQTIFQAGNSSVVAIPKNLMKELKLKKGQKVTVDKSEQGDVIMIRKNNSKRMEKDTQKVNTAITPEFKNWLDKFIVEYKDIMADLAKL